MPGNPLDAAERLAPLAARSADAAERERRLPAELIDALRDEGLLRLGVPAVLGGPEAPPRTALEVAETIARADASAGWCVSIAITSSLLAAYLEPSAASDLFGDPATVAAGVWAPRGRAVPVADGAGGGDGGYRVTGSWSFCSGIHHSDWLFAGCLVPGGDPTRRAPPEMRIVALPTTELRIEDTWHVAGLRGTGSDDAAADGVLVPREHTLSLLGPDGPVVDTPLYRFPIFGFFALGIAAAALGNARGAIDDLIALAREKTPMGSRRKLAEREVTQALLGESEAALRAARALFYDAVEQAWNAAQTQTGPVSTDLKLGLRLAATHATRAAADVTRAMYDLGGGSAIYERSPLQRRFRDAHAATAHFQVAPSTWEVAGRLLLGIPGQTGPL